MKRVAVAKKTSKLTIRKPLLIALGAILVLAIATWAWSMRSGKSPSSTISQTSPSPSASASASPTPGNGPGSLATPTPSGKAVPTPATTPASNPPKKPVAQILNTNTVSLSATSGPQIPNLETSIVQAAPGSVISLIAMGPGGKQITVAQNKTVNAGGQLDAPINWNAKTVGLTPGSWTLTIKSELGGQSSVSDPETLTVNN